MHQLVRLISNRFGTHNCNRGHKLGLVGWHWVGWGGVGLGWVGLGWVGLGWVGLGWVGLGWVGLGWVGLGWAGLGWVGFGRVGLGGLMGVWVSQRQWGQGIVFGAREFKFQIYTQPKKYQGMHFLIGAYECEHQFLTFAAPRSRWRF